MRIIVHISDIHFGQADAVIAERLVDKINEVDPHLVIVSGDLTQRARTSQFKEAREFLNKLPVPQIVVPGNHDVPLYNVYDRFANPLEKYKKYITDDLQPFYCDTEIAVLGINTARALTIKGGRINGKQVAGIQQKMDGLKDEMMKVIVTHHPFDLPEGFDDDDIVGRAKAAMPAIVDCGADVFLAGHLHVSHITHSARRYKLESGHSALIIQAGTGASTRERGEQNSFNVLLLEYPKLSVTRFECADRESSFLPAETNHFEQTPKGWSKSIKL